MQRLLFLLLSFAVLLSECSEEGVCDSDGDLPACKAEVSRGTGCRCVFNGTKARCCHFQLKHVNDYFDPCGMDAKNLTALFLFNCTTDGQSVRTLDLTQIDRKFPSLNTLAVTGADYRSINLGNDTFPKLHCLNISNNVLENHTAIAKVIDSIPSLKIIDISYNNLSFVPKSSDRSNFLLNIANNKPLKCDGIDEMMNKNITQFLNPGQTECLKPVNITEWESHVQETIKMNLSSIASTNMISRHCPEKCRCHKDRIRVDGITVVVNCSGVEIFELPKMLPHSTTTLDVSNNYITSLEPFAKNSEYTNYKSVTSLIADGNRIESLNILENADFLHYFNLLSLQRNRISKIPHFMGKLKFQGYGEMRLSGNLFTCNCDVFYVKEFLGQNHQHITDVNEIFCENIKDIKVVDVNPDMCIQPEDISYIYYIITAEVTMLLLLIGKVCYDYWVFKHSGYLPWPASKMPKLPCDCVLVK